MTIVFYCKDCGKIVEAAKVGKRYVYSCNVCGTKNVAFGTEKSIKSFFRIKEEKKVEKIEKGAKTPADGKDEKAAPAAK